MARRGTSIVLLTCLLVASSHATPAHGTEPTAGKTEPSVATGPVWPPPPATARIRFIKSVDGASDWGVARSWWGRLVDTLTGRHETQFVRPTGVAEQNGVLYVADPGAQSLVAFDAPRHKEIRITRVGDTALVSPVAVAAGPHGTVFLADSWLRQVLQLDSAGKAVRVFAHDELQRPSSIAYDASRQRLYVGDSKAHVVHVFDDRGYKVATVGRLGSGQAEFNSPTHLALGPDGSLFVTDALNFRIQAFGPDGEYLYQLGRIGDGAGDFAAPKGVAVDREGHVYVADAMFDAVQVFDAEGRLLLGFGRQGNQAGEFWIPNGLCIDADGRLFVADAYNRRVQVFEILAVSGAMDDADGGSQR